jgi:hypothetical protein
MIGRAFVSWMQSGGDYAMAPRSATANDRPRRPRGRGERSQWMAAPAAGSPGGIPGERLAASARGAVIPAANLNDLSSNCRICPEPGFRTISRPCTGLRHARLVARASGCGDRVPGPDETYSTAQRDFTLSMGPGPEPGEQALAIGPGQGPDSAPYQDLVPGSVVPDSSPGRAVAEIVSRARTGIYSTAQRDFALSMGPGPEPGEQALAIGPGQGPDDNQMMGHS